MDSFYTNISSELFERCLDVIQRIEAHPGDKRHLIVDFKFF
jgi:hypothetical protein